MKVIRKIIVIAIVLTITIILLQKTNLIEKVLKQIYTTQYNEYVEKYAKENNIDPLLIYSIIKAESNFNSGAKSASGAIGLMQIMNETAQEVSLELGYENLAEEDLYNPETNIQIGVKYFSNLLISFDGNYNLAIIAYNAGMGNVNKWLETGVIEEDGSNLENVPFKETNNYARKILRDYEIYKKLY